MKMKYEGKEPIRLVYPIDKLIEKGDVIEVDGREAVAHDLLEYGFVEVKEKTNKKEGDK
jgi:hypothetical protein